MFGENTVGRMGVPMADQVERTLEGFLVTCEVCGDRKVRLFAIEFIDGSGFHRVRACRDCLRSNIAAWVDLWGTVFVGEGSRQREQD
jgi:hypothetical protein